MVISEALSNPDRYLGFIPIQDHAYLINGVVSHLKDKNYNQEVEDAIPLIVAKCFHLNVTIFNEMAAQSFETFLYSNQQIFIIT